MKFTVPGEPQGKGRPRVVRNGAFTKTYTPEKTAAYENLVKLEFQRQCPDLWIPSAPVRMTIRAYYGLAKADSKRKRQAKLDGVIRPTKKPDIDNCIKAIADSVNGLAYTDDTQIVSVIAEKYYAEIPRVEVEIEEVSL
ncbi:MAG: RusA family crossover junction endodeoxyribonuclease [Clostridia bacterium]|nr:RusA family crossover junction endodeoxyribonuclease [Clostridia bacterium]MBQ6121547.1 RusA family crossover junction endodeoxyribonuclease [Clostridia bacterium]